MTLPSKLPIGTVYRSLRGVVTSTTVGTLTYMWGAKGVRGLDPKPYYCIPILSGLVCDWVSLDAIIECELPPECFFDTDALKLTISKLRASLHKPALEE